MKKTLEQLNKGQSGKITQMKCVGPIKQRLLDMGLVRGTDVRVERVAPLGDPIEIKVKGYMLSLRKKEAKNIEVELI